MGVGRDASVGQITGCFCRGPGFGFQHPHSGLQLSVAATGNLVLSSVLPRNQAHTWRLHIHAGKILIHIK